MADAVLVHAGLETPGGVSTDVRHIADRLALPAVATLAELSRALDEQPRALVHVFGCLPNTTTFGAMIVTKRRRRRLVWTPIFHPSRAHSWKAYGLRRPPMELFDRTAPRAARFADAVIGATEEERDFFAHWTRAELIPPGVDERPSPAPPHALQTFRAHAGLGEGPVVLTVARDNSRKALPFGLAAFGELRTRRPDAQLLLVGPEPDSPHGRSEGVHCPGWLPKRELELAYQAADLLFVPSLYEGLPRAVIEAWQFSLPVVATDRVALAQTIDGEGGRIVRYGDAAAAGAAIAELLADPELLLRYGDQGRRLVEERFLLSRVVAETERLYCEVL